MPPLEMLVEDLRRTGVAILVAGAVGSILREQVAPAAAYTGAALGSLIWVAGMVIAMLWRESQ
jgi:hypothetical protein